MDEQQTFRWTDLNPLCLLRRLGRDILLAAGKAPETVCGWVRNIGREGQNSHLCTLAELRDEQVDMFTTVFVGSSTTREIAGRMVTPRGYRAK